MANKRIIPAVLTALYKVIEDGATVTDAALVANISRQAYSLRAAAYKALGKTKEANADIAKAKELEK